MWPEQSPRSKNRTKARARVIQGSENHFYMFCFVYVFVSAVFFHCPLGPYSKSIFSVIRYFQCTVDYTGMVRDFTIFIIQTVFLRVPMK